MQSKAGERTEISYRAISQSLACRLPSEDNGSMALQAQRAQHGDSRVSCQPPMRSQVQYTGALRPFR